MNEKLKIYDEKMQKTIHALDTELASIRAAKGEIDGTKVLVD